MIINASRSRKCAVLLTPQGMVSYLADAQDKAVDCRGF
jgi:hypothetical protein